MCKNALKVAAQTPYLESLGFLDSGNVQRPNLNYVFMGMGYGSFVKKLVTFSPKLASALPWVSVTAGIIRVAVCLSDAITKKNKADLSQTIRGFAEIAQLGVVLLIADIAITLLRYGFRMHYESKHKPEAPKQQQRPARQQYREGKSPNELMRARLARTAEQSSLIDEVRAQDAASASHELYLRSRLPSPDEAAEAEPADDHATAAADNAGSLGHTRADSGEIKLRGSNLEDLALVEEQLVPEDV
ncbi:MAG: hypothetical protein H0X51_05505 [Parachlamydiaceae bacterium]|nr:hypothetical protein [Parachlamydiaceae bacterium]